jgi:endonuclease/exonuclease/phosphatase family metal-dependent hydrolase
MMRARGSALAVLTAALALAPAAAAAPAEPEQPGRELTALSRNLYVGFDVTSVLGATTPAEFVALATQGWLTVVASAPEVRAEAWADEIARTRADVVGLQEAALFRLDVPADGPATPAEAVRYDFVDLLLGALERRGLSYDVGAEFTGADLEVPTALGFDVRLTGRDVILVRADARGGKLRVLGSAAAAYAANLAVPTPFGPVEIMRGWALSDVRLRGRTFRIVNTHLEPFSTPIQVAQAQELLAGPLATSRPVLALGDFNSGPGRPTPVYGLLLGAGFVDVGAAGGLTCCHAVNLRNPVPAFTQRIDLVLARGGFRPLRAEVVGDEQAVRDALGLWPSDHGGPVATLRLPQPGR